MADSMLSLLFPACELHLLFAQNLLSLRAGALLLFRRMLLSCMYHLASVSSFSLHHIAQGGHIIPDIVRILNFACRPWYF